MSKKLNNTKQSAKGKDSVKTKGNRESKGSIVSNKGLGKVAAPDKGDEKHKNQAKNESDAKQNNTKTANTPVTNVSGNGNQNTGQQEAHTWKRGTVLIMGDSMLYGIDEKNDTVKVCCFPGTTISELQKFYVQPLISKKPSKVILHVGTNDAGNKAATA